MFTKINKKWLVGSVTAVVVVLILFINHQETFFGQEEMNEISNQVGNENIESSENEDSIKNNKPEDDQLAIVDVKGEVHKPGVYEVQNDARVHHVIELAGGFTNNANEEFINLAQKVHDEMIISVPQQDDDSVPSLHPDIKSDKIRVNYATKEEIEQLSGIGPAKAQAIIDYRDEHGMYQSIEDLLNISGIGEKTLENFRDDIQIP